MEEKVVRGVRVATLLAMLYLAAFQQAVIWQQQKQLTDQVWTINGLLAREKETHQNSYLKFAPCAQPKRWMSHTNDAVNPLKPREQ